jgi:hypothetical protein
MLSDAQAKIKAVAIQRLEFIKTIESLTSSSSLPPSSSPENSQLIGPARRKELLDKGIDGVALRYGNADMPRSLIVADLIDPVLVTSWSVLAAVLFRKQLGRLLRRILLPHHRAHHIVVLKVQVAVGGACAPHLSLTCRTLARMIHEGIISLSMCHHAAAMCPHTATHPASSYCCIHAGIISPRLSHKGFSSPEVKPGAEALTPAVRYSALLLANATRRSTCIQAYACFTGTKSTITDT